VAAYCCVQGAARVTAQAGALDIGRQQVRPAGCSLHYQPMEVWEEVPTTMTTGLLLADDATQARAAIADFLAA
jgi:hypothetical protein